MPNVGTGVLDGPQISWTRQRTFAGRGRTVGDAGPYSSVFGGYSIRPLNCNSPYFSVLINASIRSKAWLMCLTE